MNNIINLVDFYISFIRSHIIPLLILLIAFILLSRVNFKISDRLYVKGFFLMLFVISLGLVFHSLMLSFYPSLMILLAFTAYYFVNGMYNTYGLSDSRANFYTVIFDLRGYYIPFAFFIHLPLFIIMFYTFYFGYSVSPLDVVAMAYVGAFLADFTISYFYLLKNKESIYYIGVFGSSDFLFLVFISFTVFAFLFLLIGYYSGGS